MSQRNGRAAVLVLAAMLVAAPVATGIAAQNATAATGDTDPVVKFAYVDDSTGNVTLATESGDTIDMGVTADVVGAAKDLDGDYYAEVPYVTSNGALYVIDRTGEKKQLASNAKTNPTGSSGAVAKFAVGDLNGDGTRAVFFANDDNTLQKVTYNGTPQTVGTGYDAHSVAGVADVTGDGAAELVFVQGEQFHYYNSSGVVQKSFGPNQPGEIAAPRDFNNDGVARLLYVDGNKNLQLAYMNGTETTLTSDAKKVPVAAVNWTGDETLEALYFSSNSANTIKYVTLDGSTGTVRTDVKEKPGIAWVQDTDEPLEFSNFSVSNDSNSLQISFDATEDLQSVSVNVSGPDGTDLSLSDFDEVSSGADHTYVANYTPTADGTYEGTLESGESVDGDTANPDLTDSATIDRVFDVSDLNASAAPGQDLNVSFEATDELDSLTLGISGPENATLSLSEFSTSDSSAPYVYNGTYDGSSDGTYTVTFDSASAPTGTDDENLTETVTVEQKLETWDFTLTNESGKLRVAFSADERLSAATVDIAGPSNRTLDIDDFTESDTADGYRYAKTYVPDANGEYNGTLVSATSLDGDKVSPGYEDGATIDRGFTVWKLTLDTTADGDLRFGFNSTADLDSASLDLSGAENATLELSDLAETSSSDPFRYEGTRTVATDGNYTLALDSATTGMNTFDGTLTANATRNQTGVVVANATLADATNADGLVNASDSVTVTANVTGDVGSVTADASAFGAGTVALTHESGDTYAATVAVDADDTAGNETVTVTARDGQGSVDANTSNDLLLDAVDPTVAVGADRTVNIGESVTFAPETASDDASGVADYTWNLGPTVVDNRTTTYAYEDAGTYTVRLSVTDEAGNTETASLTVDVTADTPTNTDPADTTTTDPATSTTPTTTTTATTTQTTTATTQSTTRTDTTTTTTTGTTTTSDTTMTAGTESTTTSRTTNTSTQDTSAASVPGFGVAVAVVGLLAAVLLARRD
ncbi:PKD domain-containing protein [Salarchaeum japonicum]|uniref:PKD domain-containing protein n=1 Tax=Salarchaeum japonicum TaxID=555573 RepID=UPI003C738156